MSIPRFFGKWRINWMELWDKDYIDMDVEAFIEIEKGFRGEFQFGLVTGTMMGEISEGPKAPRYDFTFEGMDEMDETSGSGWVQLKSPNLIEGRFRFHNGDASDFTAEQVM